MDGGTRLIEYGIQTEDSDYRIHVCFREGAVYFFKTQTGIEALNSHKYPVKSAYQANVVGATSEGCPVPVHDIAGCQRVPIPEEFMETVKCSVIDTTSEKGRKATQIASMMMENGLIPIPIHVKIVDSKRDQIKGIDIQTSSDLKIQVKCDYGGGLKPKGTGNLFLQFAERNPLRRT